jgi:hypothetical protein
MGRITGPRNLAARTAAAAANRAARGHSLYPGSPIFMGAFAQGYLMTELSHVDVLLRGISSNLFRHPGFFDEFNYEPSSSEPTLHDEIVYSSTNNIYARATANLELASRFIGSSRSIENDPHRETESIALILSRLRYSGTQISVRITEICAGLQSKALESLLKYIWLIITTIVAALRSGYMTIAATTAVVKTFMAHRNSREPAYYSISRLPINQIPAGVAGAK